MAWRPLGPPRDRVTYLRPVMALPSRSEGEPREGEEGVVPRRVPPTPIVIRLSPIEVRVADVLQAETRVLPRVQIQFPDDSVGLWIAVRAAVHRVGRVQA